MHSIGKISLSIHVDLYVIISPICDHTRSINTIVSPFSCLFLGILWQLVRCHSRKTVMPTQNGWGNACKNSYFVILEWGFGCSLVCMQWKLFHCCHDLLLCPNRAFWEPIPCVVARRLWFGDGAYKLLRNQDHKCKTFYDDAIWENLAFLSCRWMMRSWLPHLGNPINIQCTKA